MNMRLLGFEGLAILAACAACSSTVSGTGPTGSGQPDADAGAETAPGLRAFVTAATFTGDLATQAGSPTALDAADALCQTAADGADLQGRFIAYLSSGTDDAIGRFADEAGPFHLLDGRTVAYAKASAVGAGASAALTDEKGRDLGIDGSFWTGSSAAGKASGLDCKGWRSASLFEEGSIASRFGDSEYDMACERPHHLLCLEQKGAAPVPLTKRVFVTSERVTGAFGETRSPIAVADEACAAAAKDAGLSGKFVAWLSARVGGELVRAPDRIADARYALLDGRVAFASKKDLATIPSVPIEINEFGAKVPDGTLVWTGTLRGGAPATTVNCGNWTSNSINAWGIYGYVGGFGTYGPTDLWTGGETESEVGAERCSTPMSFYCFEQ